MKKLILALLTLLLILTAAACGEDTKPGGEEPAANQEDPIENPQDAGAEEEPDALVDWNGLDFGPNLSYAEEYNSAADPGEYLSAAEAAKLSFGLAKAQGAIPGYSDDNEYTMTLVDLAAVEGEECYIYRCDGDMVSAQFAYALESGLLYTQNQGGAWLPLLDGADAE